MLCSVAIGTAIAWSPIRAGCCTAITESLIKDRLVKSAGGLIVKRKGNSSGHKMMPIRVRVCLLRFGG